MVNDGLMLYVVIVIIISIVIIRIIVITIVVIISVVIIMIIIIIIITSMTHLKVAIALLFGWNCFRIYKKCQHLSIRTYLMPFFMGFKCWEYGFDVSSLTNE